MLPENLTTPAFSIIYLCMHKDQGNKSIQGQAFDYRHFILNELESRRSRNPQYSLRAYARDLGMAAPKLSQVLSGQCGLSEASALRVAKKISLSETETQLFVSMVSARHSRSAHVRAQAEKQLMSLQAERPFDEIDLERFKIIADWYHFAILELTGLKSFKSDATWIAKRLNISKSTVKEAIERLLDFGLLTENDKGAWVQTKAELVTPSGIPSQEIRKHHRQILNKAEEALQDAVSERDFSALMFTIAKEDLPEIQRELRQFRRELAKKYSKKSKDRVYCLSTQFFALDKET